MQKNQLLKRDWEAIGIDTRLGPVAPESRDPQLANGDMLWLMPMESTRRAPLQGQMYALRGSPQADQELDLDPYERNPSRMEPEPDRMKRDALIWQMVAIHIEDGPFFIGSVANYPRVELVKEGLRNVLEREQTAPHGFVNDWHHPTSAAYDPESWYWDA